jgi:Na+/H+ antiporter NhaD/arsenite permease-like protein
MNSETVLPNPWMILPFGVLLAAIASGPFLFARWWTKHYAKVAYSLGAITLSYYLFGLHAGERVLHVGHEYVSFIVLIGSLFVVSGGIHISVKGEATPGANVVYLLVGAVLANLLGTTGASMLLIRPWIRMNRYRITAHHIVFFIFIVSNVGGCLTPIGDPPLFLGYLKGIPFWWVAEHCWPIWAIGVIYLLIVFYVVDVINYRRAPRAVRAELTEGGAYWRFEGGGNVVYLAVILGAVFVNEPPFLRETIMTAAAVASWYTTRKSIHESNQFNFHPIQEVAVLFVGIFATMLPALDWLQANAGRLATPTPASFYWGSGILSSLLDNAPTYLSFLTASFGLFVDPHLVDQVQQLVQSKIAGPEAMALPAEVENTLRALEKYRANHLAAAGVSRESIEVAFLLGNVRFNQFILAISVGAVFFGANTYIGNGPNFMVKAIADHQKVRTPGFFGFILKYSLPYMAPLLGLIWLLFFRRT